MAKDKDKGSDNKMPQEETEREAKARRKRKRKEGKAKLILWLSDDELPTTPSVAKKRKEKKRNVEKLGTKHLKKVFDQLDIDHNGSIDLGELQTGLESLGLPSDDARVQEMMAAVDADSDGQVTFAEFLQFVETREEELRALFKEMDLNGDGVLQPEEIRIAIRRLEGGNMPKAVEDRLIRELIEEMDTKGDESEDGSKEGIDFEDFRQFLVFYPAKTLNMKSMFEFYKTAAFDMGDDLSLPSDHAFNIYHPLQILTAGGLAGAVSRTCTAPFDRLKVLLQAQTPASLATGPREYTGIWQGLCKIYKDEGWRAFFKGNGTNVIKIIPESAVKFWAYDTFKRLICKDAESPHIFERLLAGSAAGVTSQTLIYPLEITKTRLAVARAGEYTGIIDCIQRIVRVDGTKALFRGLLPSLVGIVPYAGVDLAVYTQMRDFYSERYPSAKPGIITLLACGATSSTCGQIVAYPLQLVRTRLQCQGMSGRPVLYSGMTDCFRKTIASDGFLGLYKGIGPNFLKAIPAISISYVVYEQARWALGMTQNM